MLYFVAVFFVEIGEEQTTKELLIVLGAKVFCWAWQISPREVGRKQRLFTKF